MSNPEHSAFTPQARPEVIGNITKPSRAPQWWQRAGNRLDRVPLRNRLVAILLVLLVAALAITGIGTQYVLHNQLLNRVDQQLRTSATTTNISQLNGGSRSGGRLATYATKALFDDGSQPILSAPEDRSPVFRNLTSAQAAATNGEPYTVLSTTGQTRWRVIAISANIQTSPVMPARIGSIQIALPLDSVDSAVAQVRWLFVLFGLFVTCLCAALGWFAVRRAFVPLNEVEDTAAAIAAGDLSRRIPEHPKSTEVGRLTTSLNGMLAQIEGAFRSRAASEQRTRRFAADASHELRTPLASIRGFAELYRQGAVSEPEDVARTMGRIEDEARRMGLLVEDLLLLARLDEQRPDRAEPVDLLVLAGDATHDARGLAPDRAVTLTGLATGHGPATAVVIGDDSRLRQVVANLVANAVRHTPAGTPIEVAVGQLNGLAVLEVRDHGRGLDPHDAQKVFERFYRVDSSRARGQGGGSGLGLSIVATVVAAHAGRVGVAPTPGGGATFRVELPLTPARSQSDASDDADDLDEDLSDADDVTPGVPA